MLLWRRLLPALVLLVLAPLFLSLAALQDRGEVALRAPVHVFLVRHAEKERDGTPDPGLTDAGRKRAEELARVLGSAGVTRLYASEFRRTRDTLGPLAEATELNVETIPAGAPDRLTAALRALGGGSVAVVAGHSNTVPALMRALGGDPGIDQLPEDAYDRLFLVTLPDRGRPKALELRYGAE